MHVCLNSRSTHRSSLDLRRGETPCFVFLWYFFIRRAAGASKFLENAPPTRGYAYCIASCSYLAGTLSNTFMASARLDCNRATTGAPFWDSCLLSRLAVLVRGTPEFASDCSFLQRQTFTYRGPQFASFAFSLSGTRNSRGRPSHHSPGEKKKSVCVSVVACACMPLCLRFLLQLVVCDRGHVVCAVHNGRLARWSY